MAIGSPTGAGSRQNVPRSGASDSLSRRGFRLSGAGVTPEQEELVKRLKAEGKGVTAIASATGLSRPTVYSVLKA
jgi:DNA invertase Pin-like site-specific DNA recombinase